jgi:hypothetical protein
MRAAESKAKFGAKCVVFRLFAVVFDMLLSIRIPRN